MDVFVMLHEGDARVTLSHQHAELRLNFSEKIPVEQLEFDVGGNAANTAVSFARLGFSSQLYSIIGSDFLASQIRHTLEKEGVDLRYLEHYKGTTSYTTALVFRGERTLLIHHVPHQYDPPNFEPVDWVYLTSMGKSYKLAYDKALTFIKKYRPKVSFNPGSYQLKSGVKALMPYLTVTDVLFVNVEEAQHLTELSASAKIRSLCEALYDLGPKIVVITDGPKGAYTFDGSDLLFCKTFPSKVVERTGAGDAYASGVTAALLDGKDLTEAMRWGNACSAGVVGAIGPEAGLPDREKLQDSLHEHRKIVPRIIRH